MPRKTFLCALFLAICAVYVIRMGTLQFPQVEDKPTFVVFCDDAVQI